MARKSKCSQRKTDAVATDTRTSAQQPFVSPIPTNESETPSPTHEVDTPVPARDPEVEVQSLPQVSTPITAWQLCGDAIIGLAHRRKGLPCQDAVDYCNAPRPILALSDGAGSAAISERGAQALVIGVTRFLRTLEDDLVPWLDSEDNTSSQSQSTRWAERLRLHAQGLLADLARTERRDVSDVSATLQIAVIGTHHIFWWKVGDGSIVARNSEGLWSLGNQASSKGEFANQTCFVDTVSVSDVQFGVLSASEIFGIALMSDGGAERLVSHDGSKVASRLGEWLDEVAEQRFTIDRIALAFHEPAMWDRTSLDDRSIVLASRPISSHHRELFK